MSLSTRHPPDCHPIVCDCPECDAERARTSLADDYAWIGTLMLFGILVGLLLAGILDHAIAGPGLAAMVEG